MIESIRHAEACREMSKHKMNHLSSICPKGSDTQSQQVNTQTLVERTGERPHS